MSLASFALAIIFNKRLFFVNLVVSYNLESLCKKFTYSGVPSKTGNFQDIEFCILKTEIYLNFDF